MRVVGSRSETQPPTDVESRKAAFSQNLNLLLELTDSNRKETAQEAGVPYKWLRRMVSQGISRSDERSKQFLDQLVDYFALPCVEHLWRDGLVYWLLVEEEGEKFWTKFHKKIEAFWREQERRLRSIDRKLLSCLRRAFTTRPVQGTFRIPLPQDVPLPSSEDESPPSLTPEEKVTEILAAGGELEHFKDVIEVYYQKAIDHTRSKPSADRPRRSES